MTPTTRLRRAMAAESDDEEWDTVERPAFFSGSPEKEPTRREPTPDGTEPYGELTVASVFDYTIERQGLRLCVTFAIQVVTAEGDAPQGESPNDFDAGCSRSPPFWTVRSSIPVRSMSSRRLPSQRPAARRERARSPL